MRNPWHQLAEALFEMDLKAEAKPNWNRVQQKRNMQRYGAMDRRTKQGPTDYFNVHGTGKAQAVPPAGPVDMTPRPGGLSDIPFGQDVAPAPNPLAAPPRREPPQQMRRRPSWMDVIDTDEE